jgi:hypothetical protein
MDLFWYQFLFVFSAEASTDGGNGDTNTGVSNGMYALLYIHWVLFG